MILEILENWSDARKDFIKFANEIRHFADVSDQPVQQQQHILINISINIFPPGKPPPVSSDSKQLYKSKQSNSLELFIDMIEKEISPKSAQKASERHVITLT